MKLHRVKLCLNDALFWAADYCVRRDNKASLLPVILANKFYRHRKLLSVEWLDENKSGFRKTLEPEEPGYSYGPVINGSQDVKPVLLPAVNLYSFEDARVCPTSSSILLDNRLLLERVQYVEPQRCNYAAGHILRHGQNSAIVRTRGMQPLEKGIFLGGNGSFNYYHWMIEILPKVQFLPDIDEEYDSFPLLLSEDVANIPTFREALHRMVKDRVTVLLNKTSSYCVGKLVYINAPNNCPFNLNQKHKMRIADFRTRPSSIRFLRNQLCADLQDSVQQGGKRIFLARRSGRRNYNQDEIYDIFERRGFSRVLMEDLNLQRQIDIVSNAEMIAGPTGAAWTNLVFCRRGTKCLCWMADQYEEFSAYSTMARIVGADLRYVTYSTAAKSTGELYHMDYRVNARKVANALDELLRASV